MKNLAKLLCTILGLVLYALAAQARDLPSALLPYLQNPRPNGMTVCFLAQGAEAVVVSWGPEGHMGEEAIPAKGTPIPGTAWTIWKTRLSALQPGKAYQYQVRYSLGGEGKLATPLCRFRTVASNAKAVSFLELNDIHNQEKTLEANMQWIKPDDYEFSVLLGDMWADPSDAEGARKVFETMEAYIRLLNASEKPMLLTRGNHETVGSFADRLAYLFDIPGLDPTANFFDQNWYSALKVGPAWLLLLDGGDGAMKRRDEFQPYRTRQAVWVKSLLDQHADGGAPWRILLTHQPLYNNDWVYSEPCRQAWEPVLITANIDLEINGHQHCLFKRREKGQTYELGTKSPYANPWDPQQLDHYTLTPPFPGIIGGGARIDETSVKLIKVTEKDLRVRLLAGQDGRLLMEYQAAKKDLNYSPVN